MPSVTGTIIALNVAGFLLEISAGQALLESFALWPLHAGFMPRQLLTYAFLHADAMHLAFNMYGLWMFGRHLERLLGRRAFLRLYLASVLCAAGAQLLVAEITGNTYPTVGASGGVFGVLLAFAVCFPEQVIMLIFPPVALPARVFVGIYALIELTLGVTGSAAGIAHFAHLGGMAGAYLVVRRHPSVRRG